MDKKGYIAIKKAAVCERERESSCDIINTPNLPGCFPLLLYITIALSKNIM